MLKSFKIAAFALMMCGAALSSFAQSTTSATASATIVTPISIAKSVDMNFGNVAVTSSAGTVILATDGSRTKTGGVTLPAVTGTVTAAQFDVTGEGNYTYVITLPTGNHTISSGLNTMTVNGFNYSNGAGTLASGAQSFTVGATLSVSAGQAAGSYTSATPFDVTVNYN